MQALPAWLASICAALSVARVTGVSDQCAAISVVAAPLADGQAGRDGDCSKFEFLSWRVSEFDERQILDSPTPAGSAGLQGWSRRPLPSPSLGLRSIRRRCAPPQPGRATHAEAIAVQRRQQAVRTRLAQAAGEDQRSHSAGTLCRCRDARQPAAQHDHVRSSKVDQRPPVPAPGRCCQRARVAAQSARLAAEFAVAPPPPLARSAKALSAPPCRRRWSAGRCPGR